MEQTSQSTEILEVACDAALDALGEDLVALDVSRRQPFTDAFLIVTADNPRHLRSVVDQITGQLHRQLGIRCKVEGAGESEWVLIDAGDAVIHVLLPEAREYYALEKLWGHSPRIELSLKTA